MEKFNKMIRKEKMVLVMFYATWCPHCIRMRPVVARFKEQEQGKVFVAEYDIEAPASKQVVDYFGIQIIPTLILFNEGKQQWRHTGEMTCEQLTSAVERHC